VAALNPPRLTDPEGAKLNLLWDQPEWPSITAGGPRFLHQARKHFENVLPGLRYLDMPSWPTMHADTALSLRFGISKLNAASPGYMGVTHQRLTYLPKFIANLPQDPNNWTRDHLQRTAIPAQRGDRAIIAEHVRLRWLSQSLT
jgi:hypothetical protein